MHDVFGNGKSEAFGRRQVSLCVGRFVAACSALENNRTVSSADDGAAADGKCSCGVPQRVYSTQGAFPMTITQLETRIATLEQKLADLAGNVSSSTSINVNAWIDDIHGTFRNDATYRRAARLGREWRKRLVTPLVAKATDD